MAKDSRTKNVRLNTIWALINQIVTVLLGLISRKVFLSILGAELLGTNSLFSDVLSLFSFADLGFGVAISFSLYKPIADNDIQKVKSLLRYLQVIYYYVIGTIIAISIIFLPCLNVIRTNIPIRELRIYYCIYQLQSIIEYICVYRETYVTAAQQNRFLSKFGVIYSFARHIIQIVVVLILRNFYAYLIAGLILSIGRKVYINVLIRRKFPETNLVDAEQLDSNSKLIINTNAKAVLIHRIGNLAINQTDSLIISSFVNVGTWGLVSNYIVLRAAIQRIGENIYSSFLPSFGNLIALKDQRKHIDIFLKYDFLNYIFYLFCFVCLGNLSSRFIELYFGKQYVLDDVTIFLLFYAFYIDGLRNPVSALREAGGTYKEDRWYTVVAALVNLVVSIVLVRPFGISGVYIGTICAMLVLHIVRTCILFSNNYSSFSAKEYFIILSRHFIVGAAIYGIIYSVCIWITKVVNSDILCFILCILTCATLLPLIIFVLYRNSIYTTEYLDKIASLVHKDIS